MSPTLVTFLFEAANFLVLAAALGWLLFKPVRKALAEHHVRLDALAKQAQDKLAAAEKSQADLEAQRQAFSDELAKLRSDTLAAARDEADKLIVQAREQARQIRVAAEQHVARIDAAQNEALAKAVAVAAGAAVGRLLEQIGGPDLEAALLRAACRQLAGLEFDSQSVTIESAAPLSASDRAEFDRALGSAAVHATCRVVKELGGGVRVTTNRGLIDASIAGLADFARSALATELSPPVSSGAPHV